ncbi:MAG: Fe-S-containing hydro-lyase [Candidatus Omnitrophica bacterium]|nr:Fe-S-containing hydro-lyase [Candidatus Omnitrophota bacterium]MBU1047219.1 Fe-S-containing hydro-lyase [Candidatus Omnitrophota bacterium]MBU1630669.1 Fe-S-containing hydro-lyase [Candidatus Omnitrophota bacterium]MBU1889519.1 Fe-S-containing hydro-lyase [Candidatus Omnitrophota bacterium]
MKMLTTPLTLDKIASLSAGDIVSITGIIYTARDAAHKKILEAIAKKKALPASARQAGLPFDLKSQIIYYAGPTPAVKAMPIGSCGPTTSSRMDSYTVPLLEKELKGMIGKGKRSEEVIKAIKKHKAVYFLAVGGAAALLATKIKKSKIIAYSELGTEAIRELEIKDFPVIVAIDSKGKNIFDRKKKG